jgi:type I restriction enzyme, S subunit
VVALGSLLKRPPRYGIGAPAVPYRADLPTYLRITDISERGRFAPEPAVSVNSALSGGYFLADGELVVARTGNSVGKSYRYRTHDGPLVFAGFLMAITPDPDRLDPGYLGHYLQTKRYWDWVQSESMRSGQPGINARQLASMPIQVPNIDVQRSVAGHLEDVDRESDAIELLIRKKRAIKLGTMQELLTGRTRLPGFTGPWGKPASFMELCTRSTGFWGAGAPSSVAPHRVHVITAGDITPRGHIKGAAERYFTTAQLTKARCRAGDLVITSSGNGLGKTAYIDDPGALVASNFVRILRPRRGVSGSFLAQIMLTPGARAVLDANTATSAYPNLLPSFYAEEWIPTPLFEEQRAIAQVLTDADAEIAVLERRLEATRAIKQGMMQEFLTGRTRLVPAEASL